MVERISPQSRQQIEEKLGELRGGQIGEAVAQILEFNKTPAKANVLVVGPSGCGKTYTGEIAARLVGVPFAVEDLTKFSEVGYVGQNVSDILLDLLIAAGGNPHGAQRGIGSLDGL